MYKNQNPELFTIPADGKGVKYCLLHKPTGQLYFFEVVERKGGRRYVNRLLGAPGDWRRIHVPTEQLPGIIHRIAADPAGAAKSFADHFTCCAKCLSPLTDEESRALGLGPVCRKAFGL